MEKLKGTKEEIQAEIQRRIATSNELDGDCKGCRAPTPRYADPNTNNGCNWRVDVFPGVVSGCLDFLKNITLAVMSEYELVD
jgi:hypothetical protein